MIRIRLKGIPPEMEEKLVLNFQSIGLPKEAIDRSLANKVMPHACLVVTIHILNQQENSGYLKLNCLGLKFLRGSELPDWRLEWKDGLDAMQVERLKTIIAWVSEQDQCWRNTENVHGIHSRCADIIFEFSILNQRKLPVPVSEIIHIQAQGEFSLMTYGHQGSPRTAMIDYKLGECEALLMPYGMVRIHRSHLINLGCITEVQASPPSGGSVRLCHDIVLAVARRRFQHIATEYARMHAVHGNIGTIGL